MVGVCVQLNEASKKGAVLPVGYVIEENGCWTWFGSLTSGYGNWYWNGRTRRAHRVMYERLVGRVPEGLFLDHLCRNRACVNPAHLEPVTCRENTMRGAGLVPKYVKSTHCTHGHEYTPENTRFNSMGHRFCRECHRVWARKYYHRNRATRAAEAA